MQKTLLLYCILTSVIIAQPGSDVPGNMSFQGLLTDSEGVSYEDGEYDLVEYFDGPVIGQLSSRTFYKDGNPELKEEYHEDGQIKSRSTYKDGNKTVEHFDEE